jgi:hypothetical protein
MMQMMMSKSVPEVASPSVEIQDDNVEDVELEQTNQEEEEVVEGESGLDNLILEGDA